MTPLIEKYPFKKFWEMLTRQNRCVSKWDEHRTDQDVFIRRTLDKWFSGKCYQVVFDKFVPSPRFQPIDPVEPYRIKYTKYMAIAGIELAFSRTEGAITVKYVEPHSMTLEKMVLDHNDWCDLSVMDDNESFVILRRFYPVERNEIKLPTLQTLNTEENATKRRSKKVAER